MDAFGTDLLPLFLLGFLGTAHCLGMCGPLVLSLPGRGGRLATHLAYHAGRILTYGALAALAAGLGAGVDATDRALAVPGGAAGALAPLTRVQVALSLASAALLLSLGLFRLGIVREPAFLSGAGPQRLPGARRLARAALTGGGLPAVWAFGLLMGLLPCGLSWAAFARALAAPDPLRGATLGVAFGLGTLPGLLLLGTAAATALRRHARLVDLLSGMLLVGMALALGADALAALA